MTVSVITIGTKAEWVDTGIAQRKEALFNYGRDDRASTPPIEQNNIAHPFTPFPYALAVFKWWRQYAAPIGIVQAFGAGRGEINWTGQDGIVNKIATLQASFISAIDSYIFGDIVTPMLKKKVVGNALAALSMGEIPSPVPFSKTSATSPLGYANPLAKDICQSLEGMAKAIVAGVQAPLSVNESGIPCLHSVNNWQFWRHCRFLATSISATEVTIKMTAPALWREAVEEAKQESIQKLKDGAEAVGEAAGSALTIATTAAAKGVKGFLDELGFVNAAVIGGGIYLGVKYL